MQTDQGQLKLLVGQKLGQLKNHELNTRVILAVIFMIVITPFSFVMWIFGRDRMKRGFDPKCESYRVPSPPRPPQSMEKPF